MSLCITKQRLCECRLPKQPTASGANNAQSCTTFILNQIPNLV